MILPRYHMSDNAAKQMERTGKFADIRLLSKQPPKDSVCYHTDEEDAFFTFDNKPYESCNAGDIPLTYPSGPYRCTEPWSYIWLNDERKRYFYKSTDKERYELLIQIPKWRSPATMPASAIRYPEVKIDTVVKRLSELITDDLVIKHFGFLDPQNYPHKPPEGLPTNDFIKYWNVTLGHAKPILTKDKTGYVCYPYSFDDWEKYCLDDTRYMIDVQPNDDGNPVYYNKWKGKDLTICTNPVVELIKGERKG